MPEKTGYEEMPTTELREKLERTKRNYNELCEFVPPGPIRIRRGRGVRRHYRQPIPLSVGQQERATMHEDIEKMTVELSRRGELGNTNSQEVEIGNETQLDEKPSTGFDHSSDFRSVKYNDQTYTLSRNQAYVVEILFDAYQRGFPDVGKDFILQKIESTNTRLRDLFRSSGLWNTLIVSGKKRGTHRLNLPGEGSSRV